jgi:hypothetical protein
MRTIISTRPAHERDDPPAMKASRFLITTLKEAPADADIVSHRLMTRAGMIRKLAGGSTRTCRWACA